MSHENDTESRLNVYGRGVSSARPDYFSIHFEASTEDPDDEYSYTSTAKKAEKLLKAVKSWVKEDDLVRTTSFSFDHYMLSEKRGAWPKGKVIARVSTTIHVESGRVDDVASLISLARKSGASEISDVTFSLSDSRRKEERDKALTLAAEAAKSDAEITAKAFGVSVLGLSSVDIMNGFSHDNYSDRYCLDKCIESSSSLYDRESDMPSEFIEAGEIKTSVCIDAVFRLSR